MGRVPCTALFRRKERAADLTKRKHIQLFPETHARHVEVEHDYVDGLLVTENDAGGSASVADTCCRHRDWT